VVESVLCWAHVSWRCASIALSGDCYENGKGVKKDAVEAARQYQAAVDLNSDEAKVALGRSLPEPEFSGPFSDGSVWNVMCAGALYREGKGNIAKDHKKAFELFESAAESKHPAAFFHLGRSSEMQGSLSLAFHSCSRIVCVRRRVLLTWVGCGKG
jgi:TPR repeat protein